MREEMIEIVRAYLEKEFSDRAIEYKHDFDRDVEKFKVPINKRTALLMVGGQFLDDTSADEVSRLLDWWAVSNLLEEEQELGLMATASGVIKVER